jgi:hypothetical protein
MDSPSHKLPFTPHVEGCEIEDARAVNAWALLSAM